MTDSDFGHSFVNAAGCHIDSWGAGPFVITAGGKTFRFEDSDRFGPSFVDRHDRIKENQLLPSTSPFWSAYSCWKQQGRRIGEDRFSCIWDEPKPTLVERVAGRHVKVISFGDEHGPVRFIGEVEP
jgi:hypothetical protein